MKARVHTRPAFTLIELIVVISIIALLAAISISAVFRLQETSRESNTNKTLLKVQMGLDPQVKAARDTIAKETPSDWVKTWTSSRDSNNNLVPDPIRAKALHMKLRMRQEFPQTYAEARALLGDPMYGSKLMYRNAIGAGSSTPDLEAAALLVVALSQNRGGITFSVEEIGRTEVRDIGGKQMRVILDEYGTPICLRRWATDGELNSLPADELNQQPFVSPSQIASGNKDPDDPEGRFRNPAPRQWDASYKTQAELLFTSVLPTVADPLPDFPVVSRNRGPYVVSAGKDKLFVTEDDLFSFRIQGSGKGN